MSYTPVAPIITLIGACFRHPGGHGVTDVTFSVLPGDAVALIGPNGAGKSTLLAGLLGLVPCTAGEMHVPGGLGYLPQVSGLDPDFPLTVGQLVMLGRYRKLGLWRWPGAADRAAVAVALDLVGLRALRKRQVNQLSGGQRQRAVLARALVADPAAILLDEPFNGLDQGSRDALVETIRVLKRRGVAFLVSTHDTDLAVAVCDTAVLLNGRQIAAGPVSEVLGPDGVSDDLLCVDDSFGGHDHH
ncbi:MAG: hypothetical protein B5766_06105 [Candidatus Lumbricidophila eiseniae]|uniref:ABC transporter domain-containing protein n=1 Tax=Candidatus Lumbricidiphila eiseniae TaxID=1969409 RepID=A0A2A6FS05_9MICO|nr:MAG: hypothetical protein B5766_06105 [Candidatus Lumbricidophila eiseniae]